MDRSTEGLVEYRSPPRVLERSPTLGRDAVIVGVLADVLTLVGIACLLLRVAAGFDMDPALFVGYAATVAGFAWGFVGICLAVVNLYDYGGSEPRTRLALALSIAAVICGSGVAFFGGLIG